MCCWQKLSYFSIPSCKRGWKSVFKKSLCGGGQMNENGVKNVMEKKKKEDCHLPVASQVQVVLGEEETYQALRDVSTLHVQGTGGILREKWINLLLEEPLCVSIRMEPRARTFELGIWFGIIQGTGCPWIQLWWYWDCSVRTYSKKKAECGL